MPADAARGQARLDEVIDVAAQDPDVHAGPAARGRGAFRQRRNRIRSERYAASVCGETPHSAIR